jgi:hypothetical protein
MLKYQGKARKRKVARTMVPKTAEFEPYAKARAKKATAKLVDEAFAAFGRSVDASPDLARSGLRPDDLYAAALAKKGLRKRWEAAFDGEESGRRLFGLVAWTYFFQNSQSWLGTAPETSGVGKRGWIYAAEPEASAPAPRISAPLAEAPVKNGPSAIAGVGSERAATTGFKQGDCVRLRGAKPRYGRVVRGPQERPELNELIPKPYYRVRLKEALDVPFSEQWVKADDLTKGEDGFCDGIP